MKSFIDFYATYMMFTRMNHYLLTTYFTLLQTYNFSLFVIFYICFYFLFADSDTQWSVI